MSSCLAQRDKPYVKYRGGGRLVGNSGSGDQGLLGEVRV